MSCPYFEPVEPRAQAGEPQSAMLPLGDSWTGICRADSSRLVPRDESTVRRLCNLGYARGTCPSFPSNDGPDAVRFAIRNDDGAVLRIWYVVERDHHPFAHGYLDYSVEQQGLTTHSAGEPLARQAEAYARSYLHRKAEAFAR